MILLKEPPGGFCVAGCFYFTSLEFFPRLLFDVIRHPAMSYSQVFPYGHLSIKHFQPISSQSNMQHFHLEFSGIFIVPQVLQFWASVFYTQANFILHLLPTLVHLWLRCKQEQHTQDFLLCLLLQSCPFRPALGL